jgi:endogenous inhibitor of DNA gyrase (YacG/DUF329 family)
LDLWQPNSDISEPLFAAGAARLGLTPKSFMDTVHMRSTQIGSSLKLSKDAKLLFSKQDHNRPSRSVAANKHSSMQHESHKLCDVTNKRPVPDCPVDPYNLDSEVAPVQPTEARPASNTSCAMGNIEKRVKRPRCGDQPPDLPISDQDPNGRSMPGASEVLLPTRNIGRECGRVPSRELLADATCPMCGVDIERRLMHQHLEQCLQDSECFSTDSHIPPMPTTPPRAMMSNVHSRPVDKTTDLAGSANCPICDKALSRKDLETHTALCMDQSGLVDAFG